MNLCRPLAQPEQQCAWIIGASHGIGAALAHAFIALGSQVIISARDQHSLHAMAKRHPGRCQPLPLDVRDSQQWRAALDATDQHQPIPNLVVYCAGNYTPMSATELDSEQMLAMVDTHLGGLMRGLPGIIERLQRVDDPRLVIVGSVAGYRGLPRALAYGACKAAMIHMAETLAPELSPLGISVHIVNPGFVQTRLTAKNDFKMPAMLSPDQAAQAILTGLQRGDFEIHFPKRFTCWLALLRLLPYRLYFSLIRRLTRA